MTSRQNNEEESDTSYGLNYNNFKTLDLPKPSFVLVSLKIAFIFYENYFSS